MSMRTATALLIGALLTAGCETAPVGDPVGVPTRVDLLDEGFVRRVRHFRSRGSSGKLNIALDGLPTFSALPEGSPLIDGDMHIVDSVERIVRANSVRRGSRMPTDSRPVRLGQALDRPPPTLALPMGDGVTGSTAGFGPVGTGSSPVPPATTDDVGRRWQGE